MISDDMRRSLTARVAELEGAVRTLAREIVQQLPPEARQVVQRNLRDKSDLLFGEMEDVMIAVSVGSLAQLMSVDRIRQISDQVIRARAEYSRLQRSAHHEDEELSLEERRLANRHLREELEAEQP